jgi:hypothetical protein
MFRPLSGCLSRLVVCALFSTTVFAGGHNAADYPLRAHIFSHNSHSHYRDRTLDWVDGEGRANLFENGEPRGFDYSYRCSERLRNSSGFETYLARWKKRDQTLEILLPKLGKLGATDACELRVEMKDIAYYRHDGLVDTEPPATFKQWMEKHQYDPEHGKDQPVRTAPGEAAPATNPPE